MCIRDRHMALLIVHNKLAPERRKYLMCFIDALVFVFALAVLTVGGAKLAFSARKEFSSLLGISRSLVYSMAPVSGVFIMAAQVINILSLIHILSVVVRSCRISFTGRSLRRRSRAGITARR